MGGPIHLYGKMLRIRILDISFENFDPIELKHDEEHRRDTNKLKQLIENPRWPPQLPS